MVWITSGLSDLSSSAMLLTMNEIEQNLPSLEDVEAELLALQIQQNELEDQFYSYKDRVVNFFKVESHKVLGYDSPSACYDECFGDGKLSKELRKELVPMFKEHGDSEVQISKALGVHRTTVRSDLGKTVPVQNVQPAIEPDEILDPITPGPEEQHPFHDPNLPSAEELHEKLVQMITKDDEGKVKTPADIEDDKGVLMCLTQAQSSVEFAGRFNRGKMTPKAVAKARIEIQILRDMIDDIENRL